MKGFHPLSRLFFVLSFYLIAVTGSVYAQIIPSDEWINFYSSNSLFHGEPVPAGAVIDAYDPDGIHCGTFRVSKAGKYGFLIVYRDDALTENVDEGAVPGDSIAFKINGIPVKALGPDVNIWTQKGDILQVNLADNLWPTIADSLGDVIMIEDAPDTIIADLDTIFNDPDNDSLIFSSQSSVLGVQPEIDNEHRLIISLVANWSGLAVLILTAQDEWFTVNDTIMVQVLEVNDPPVIHNFPDTSFSSDTTLTIDLNKYVEDIDHHKSSLSWTAEVQSPYDDSLFIEIDDSNKLATFIAKYIFSACVKIVFTVTDASSGFDQDTMSVQVNLPADVEYNLNFYQPKIYCLSQNYPNPFNSTTRINYQLPKHSHVTLKIINSLGKEVVTLVDESQSSGYYFTHWEANNQASGVYFIWLKAGDFSQMRKMLLLR